MSAELIYYPGRVSHQAHAFRVSCPTCGKPPEAQCVYVRGTTPGMRQFSAHKARFVAACSEFGYPKFSGRKNARPVDT